MPLSRSSSEWLPATYKHGHLESTLFDLGGRLPRQAALDLPTLRKKESPPQENKWQLGLNLSVLSGSSLIYTFQV